jgi:ADP-ribose pyrophosphatase
MALSHWKKLASSIVIKNPWWEYRKDETELPSGRRGEYHYVHTNGASCIVPILPDGRLVLVNQYRYLLDKESLEFPCGGVKDGHSYEQTAEMELVEEAGYQARDWKLVGEYNPYNGVTTEICRVYLARDLFAVPPTPEETEEFEIVVLTRDELERNIMAGVIWDGMTMAAWAIARHYI